MATADPGWRRRLPPWWRITLPLLLASAVVLIPAFAVGPLLEPARADTTAPVRSYRCDGDPLEATVHAGAVDDPAIPGASAGTLPGAFVVLQWRQLNLQLPRTNNAGPPSFTDGRWWWSLEDSDHPRLRLRRGLGDVQDFACGPMLQAEGP